MICGAIVEPIAYCYNMRAKLDLLEKIERKA
jgi:hypothetical protein